MNNEYKDYQRIAYRRAIVGAVRRFVSEYLQSDLPAGKSLLCEEVLAADREVSEESFEEYLEELVEEEAALKVQMNHFEFRRKPARGSKQSEDKKSSDSEGTDGKEEGGGSSDSEPKQAGPAPKTSA